MDIFCSLKSSSFNLRLTSCKSNLFLTLAFRIRAQVMYLKQITFIILITPWEIRHWWWMFIFSISFLYKFFTSGLLNHKIHISYLESCKSSFSKKLWFFSSTNTSTTPYNFSKFLKLRVHIFIYNLTYGIAEVTLIDTISLSLLHLFTKKLKIQEEHPAQNH